MFGIPLIRAIEDEDSDDTGEISDNTGDIINVIVPVAVSRDTDISRQSSEEVSCHPRKVNWSENTAVGDDGEALGGKEGVEDAVEGHGTASTDDSTDDHEDGDPSDAKNDDGKGGSSDDRHRLASWLRESADGHLIERTEGSGVNLDPFWKGGGNASCHSQEQGIGEHREVSMSLLSIEPYFAVANHKSQQEMEKTDLADDVTMNDEEDQLSGIGVWAAMQTDIWRHEPVDNCPMIEGTQDGIEHEHVVFAVRNEPATEVDMASTSKHINPRYQKDISPCKTNRIRFRPRGKHTDGLGAYLQALVDADTDESVVADMRRASNISNRHLKTLPDQVQRTKARTPDYVCVRSGESRLQGEENVYNGGIKEQKQLRNTHETERIAVSIVGNSEANEAIEGFSSSSTPRNDGTRSQCQNEWKSGPSLISLKQMDSIDGVREEKYS